MRWRRIRDCFERDAILVFRFDYRELQSEITTVSRANLGTLDESDHLSYQVAVGKSKRACLIRMNGVRR
jgi:hypothetical protein